MNIKNCLVTFAVICSFSMCYEKIKKNLSQDAFGDSACENDSLSKSIMSSDKTSFVGNSNTLTVTFDSEIKKADIQGKNLNILSKSLIGNNLSVNVDAKSKFSTLSIFSSDKAGGKYENNYYLYKKDGMTYVSSTSMDSAIAKANDDSLTVNSPVVNNMIDITNPNPVISYKGTLKWMDDNGKIYPLAGAKISAQVKKEQSKPINPFPETKFVYTNGNGYFDLGLDSNTAVANTLTLSLSGQFASVYRVNNNDKETIGFDGRTSLYKLSLDKFITCFDLNIPVIITSKTNNDFESDFGQATQIFEAMYYYSKFAKKNISAENLTPCKVNYPCQYDYSTKENGLFRTFTAPFYRRTTQTIYLPDVGKKKAGSSLEVYQSWDAIGHEYGHHLGYITGYCTSTLGGSHNSMKDDVRTVVGDDKRAATVKEINHGLNLAWSESWPTYWSQVAQFSFPENLRENNKTLANEKYEAYNLTDYYSIAHEENFNLKEKTNNICGGDANERGIMRFLYETNRAIGGINKAITADNLWILLKESYDLYGSEFQDNNSIFGYFYEHLYATVLFSGKYKHLTLEHFFNMTSYYWFSPLKTKSSRTSNGIHLTWTQGGNYKNETTESYCYLEYLDKDGNYLQYREIKAKCIGLGKDDMYWFEADVPEPLLDNASMSDVSKIILNYSPRAYREDKKGSFSSSYPRVIWQGEDFTIDNFASINMDKELILYVKK